LNQEENKKKKKKTPSNEKAQIQEQNAIFRRRWFSPHPTRPGNNFFMKSKEQSSKTYKSQGLQILTGQSSSKWCAARTKKKLKVVK